MKEIENERYKFISQEIMDIAHIDLYDSTVYFYGVLNLLDKTNNKKIKVEINYEIHDIFYPFYEPTDNDNEDIGYVLEILDEITGDEDYCFTTKEIQKLIDKQKIKIKFKHFN